MFRRRVAVTGMGVVASCGIGTDAFWDGLCGDAPEGDRRVHDFDPSPHFENPKAVRRSDRCTQFAIAAADMALEQAGTLTADSFRRGVFIGTGIGGIATLEEQILIRHEKGSRRVSPFMVPMMMPNAAPAAVSMRHGFQGPAENTCTACAAGTHALANAARLIAHGRCDVVLAGGSEAPFVETAIAGFTNMTAFSSVGISRPFDAERDGFVMGEGAGIMLLEEWDMAVERGATILAEILGGASTADAHHITAPSPGGVGAITCMRLALEEAGVEPDQVRHINAHGTSTPLNDMAEALAMAEVFGPVIDARYVIQREVDYQYQESRYADTWVTKHLPKFASDYIVKNSLETKYRREVVKVHAVPRELARNKKRASKFEEQWNIHVSPGNIWYYQDDGTKSMLQEAAEQGWLPYNRVRQKEVFM